MLAVALLVLGSLLECWLALALHSSGCGFLHCLLVLFDRCRLARWLLGHAAKVFLIFLLINY